ncbi:MAG: IS21-like element helper ATPase IstB [Oscillochloridaceae bacterium umkhey_bin13]
MMNRHAELTTLLRELRLQAMADHVSDVAVKAVRANLSHEAFLYELARLEQEQRTQRRIDRLRRESGAPREKTFATLDLASYPPLVRQQVERLRRGEFVTQAINVVAVGPPGVGKSHLLASVAHTLMQQGVAVLWSSTAQLMQRLLAAKRDLRLPQELAKLDRFACLVLDDIGYVQHDQDEMEVLFTLLSERYERRSVMLSTNLVFSEWTRIFKHPLTTVAAIDRVVHHSVILDLTGMPSYRAQAARAAQQAGVAEPAVAADAAVDDAGGRAQEEVPAVGG